MPRTPKPPKPATLTIAIDGAGVTPKDVSLRNLIEVLEAAAYTFEAIADEKRLGRPKLSLARIKEGSAELHIYSEDRQTPRVFDRFVAVARRRGKGASPNTRRGLERIHNAGARAGATIRIGGKTRRPLLLAAPVPEDETKIQEATVVFARVVGVNIDARERATVKLRYDDGGSHEFVADSDTLGKAATLIGLPVEARVTLARGESTDSGLSIESIKQRRPQSSFMALLEETRERMIARGIVYDSTAIIAEDRDDDAAASSEGASSESDRG
ncbi:MAG TPA: hypothetical protein VK932_00685 [Kofleriaceae bacterium]|nr:hypothetical protein [Kofleriaceae bacterium]